MRQLDHLDAPRAEKEDGAAVRDAWDREPGHGTKRRIDLQAGGQDPPDLGQETLPLLRVPLLGDVHAHRYRAGDPALLITKGVGVVQDRLAPTIRGLDLDLFRRRDFAPLEGPDQRPLVRLDASARVGPPPLETPKAVPTVGQSDDLAPDVPHRRVLQGDVATCIDDENANGEGVEDRLQAMSLEIGSLVLTLDLLEERGVARCRGSRIARRVRGLLGGDLLPGTPLGLLDARGKPCTSTPCREHREGNGEDQQQDGHGRNGGQGSFQPPVCTVVEYGDSDDGGVARSTPRGDARCRTLAALAFEPRRQAQSFPGGARSDARTTRAIGPRIDPTYRSRSVPRTAGSFHRSSV